MFLDESTVDPDPIRQFSRWFEEALASGAPEANAMSLAAATAGGAPSVRMVLLKGFDARGFVFFNYESRKSRELDENPRAALCLYWREPEREGRITGGFERTADGNMRRPSHWGGFLVPEVVEFWQGRSGRLHDRIRYRKAPGTWVIERLAP